MDPRDDHYLARLPAIPLIEAGEGGALAIARAGRGRLMDILDQAHDHYGGLTISVAERMSEYWLARNDNAYYEEILNVADFATEHGAGVGAYMLNMSFEWSCTAGVGPDPQLGGNRMLRTLDWPMDGLGRNLVVARILGEAGSYDAVTWPGFAGIMTAMAPGRFSAAINQPPMRRWSPARWLDWAINRTRVWRQDAPPPAHLLRQVFDQCETYVEAREILINTPIAMPAFFTLSGLGEEHCCVIERTEDEVCVHYGPGAVANHWLRMDVAGHKRGIDSYGRFAQMNKLQGAQSDNFDWVRAPILNPTTRVSVVANAQHGRLQVMGWEYDKETDQNARPATTVYDGYSK